MFVTKMEEHQRFFLTSLMARSVLFSPRESRIGVKKDEQFDDDHGCRHPYGVVVQGPKPRWAALGVEEVKDGDDPQIETHLDIPPPTRTILWG